MNTAKPLSRLTSQATRTARRTAFLGFCAALVYAAIPQASLARPAPTSATAPKAAQFSGSGSSEHQPAIDTDAGPTIESSRPAPEATHVSGETPLTVRFSQAMTVASLSAQTITLIGPGGAEPIQVTSTLEGREVVIRPNRELLPASRYTLFLRGVIDRERRSLPLSAIGFDTAAKFDSQRAQAGRDTARADAEIPSPPATNGNDNDGTPRITDRALDAAELRAVRQADRTHTPVDWIPGPKHFHGAWETGRPESPLQTLPALQGTPRITALSGQVLGLDQRAVSGVTLRIGGVEARTDATGRFLLQGLAPGFAKLEIDGTTADRRGTRYGYYAARIEVKAEQTNVLPYVIWMPRLDPAGTVRIAAPTTKETVVKSPRIPGLELHIPAGTVFRDRHGRILTELNLTAIPVDRPPFPLPELGVPVYFTIQPGGAVLQSANGQASPGARLFYPNFKREVPGARGVFWNYDAEDRGWFVYGTGTISRDGKQAIPDKGVVIHELTGAMFSGNLVAPVEGPPPGSCGTAGGDGGGGGGGGDCGGGDSGAGSVSLQTGQLDLTEHDMVIGEVLPIDVARTYNSADKNQRAFGIGSTHVYDMFLATKVHTQSLDLIMPNGTRVSYERTSLGNDVVGVIYESHAPGQWTGAQARLNPTTQRWEMTFRDGRQWNFSQSQPLTHIIDANGNTTRIEREGGTSGKVTRIISPNGRTVSFGYNARGFISSLTDNIGRSFAYNYDSAGHLTQVVDPKGATRGYTWDTTNHRITGVKDATGATVVTNEYDDTGRVKTQTFADGSSYAYAYTVENGVTTQTDVTDPRGSVRRVQFNAAGYMIKNTYPAGRPEERVLHYEVNDGRLMAAVDALNRRTEFQYDSLGNTTKVTRLAGTANAVSVNVTYNSTHSRPLTVTDPVGNTTTMSYDSKGNLTGVTDALGHSQTFTYDSQGRPQTSTDPLGRVAAITYDGPDLSAVTDPIGRQAHVVSDGAGRTIISFDALGNRTLYDWDDLNQLISTTDPLGGVTRFDYDTNGNLRSKTDAKGHTTSYTYNAQDQVESVRDPLSRQSAYSYHPGGQLAHSVDRNGQLIAISYDALGRVSVVGFGATEAAPTAFKSQLEYSWDAANRPIQITDRTCANPLGSPLCGQIATTKIITRHYDDHDRLTQEVAPQGQVDYTYDALGRRTSMVITNGPPGAQVTQAPINYEYDDINRLTSITQAAGGINGGVPQQIVLSYDATGQRTHTTLANGATIDYEYDDAGQLTVTTYKKSDGELIGTLTYQYNANGQRASTGGTLAQLDLPTSDVTSTSYDANDRLLAWGDKAYDYDSNGNLIGDRSHTYEWDERGQLASIRSGVIDLAHFEYDGSGRRISKTIGSDTTGFLYDGVSVAQELRGNSNSAAVKAQLLTGGIDETLLRIEGADPVHQHSVLSSAENHTVMLLNGQQNKSVGYTYDPYGATSSDTASNNPQQYTGRENDDLGNDEGLYYYRARYYMPGIGRFVSEDPIGWASGQTNNYAYVGGDPINFTDPLGLGVGEDITSFFAGFGDMITFGLTQKIRAWMGIDGGVDPCSGWYTAGELAGIGAGLVSAGGALRAAARAARGAKMAQRALPAARQIEAAWGAARYRRGGLMSGIEHVMHRHSASSGFANVSRFAEGTSVRNIASYVDQALRYGTVTQTAPTSYTIEHVLGHTIGTDIAGAASRAIQVFVRDGIIQTAFPF